MTNYAGVNKNLHRSRYFLVSLYPLNAGRVQTTLLRAHFSPTFSGDSLFRICICIHCSFQTATCKTLLLSWLPRRAVPDYLGRNIALQKYRHLSIDYENIL